MNRKTFIQFGTVTALGAYVKPSITPLQANAMLVSPISTHPTKVTITYGPTRTATTGERLTPTPTGTPGRNGTATPTESVGTASPTPSSSSPTVTATTSVTLGTATPTATISPTPSITPDGTRGVPTVLGLTPTSESGTATVVTTHDAKNDSDKRAGSSSRSRSESGNGHGSAEIRINSDTNLTTENGQHQRQVQTQEQSSPSTGGLVFPGHAVVPPLFVTRPPAHGSPAVPGQLPNAGEGNNMTAAVAGWAAVGTVLCGTTIEFLRRRKNRHKVELNKPPMV